VSQATARQGQLATLQCCRRQPLQQAPPAAHAWQAAAAQGSHSMQLAPLKHLLQRPLQQQVLLLLLLLLLLALVHGLQPQARVWVSRLLLHHQRR
jgi:hypothetical protein